MAFQKKVIRAVTKQHITMQKGREYYLGFLSHIYQGEAIEHASQAGKQPPMMADVIDLETGEAGCIILVTVAVKELVKHYPEGVAGRSFALTIIAPRDGKSYNTVNVQEIDGGEAFDLAFHDWQRIASQPLAGVPAPAKKGR
jgi:hypothetical protein